MSRTHRTTRIRFSRAERRTRRVRQGRELRTRYRDRRTLAIAALETSGE